MSKVNALEKLLDGAGVEWVPLAGVATLQRGRVMSKEYLADNAGDYPVYSSQTANNGMIGKIDTFDFDGEFISWTTDGANAGTVFHRTGKFSVTNVCGLITINDGEKLNYKFLFYWLSTEAKKHVYSGMGNPKLMSHQVEKISIPIPCPDDPKKSLAIQAEIVRILDAFTALTAELTAELTARKKQYNHYRDQLLTFDENKRHGFLEKILDGAEVQLKSLGEVCEIKNGYTPSKTENDFWKNGIVPWFRMEDIRANGRVLSDSIQHVTLKAVKSGKLFPANSIIISTTATIGEHALITSDFLCNQQLTILSVKKDCKKYLDYKYLFYYSFIIGDLCRKSVSPNGFALVGTTKIRTFKIPIPCPDDPKKSLAIQAEIVRILDKFDALTNSLQEGLPCEIDLRQKQYEYYRDLLLNFPKPEEQAV